MWKMVCVLGYPITLLQIIHWSNSPLCPKGHLPQILKTEFRGKYDIFYSRHSLIREIRVKNFLTHPNCNASRADAMQLSAYPIHSTIVASPCPTPTQSVANP